MTARYRIGQSCAGWYVVDRSLRFTVAAFLPNWETAMRELAQWDRVDKLHRS